MRTEDFDFELPRALIAQAPASPRESARLLIVNDALQDRGVRDLPALLQPGDILVVNDTRVIPSRLFGKRGEAQVEATLIEPLPGPEIRWRAFARPARKLRVGERIAFAADFSAEVIAKEDGGAVVLGFDFDPEAFHAALERYGAMPLPPYIRRPRGGAARDKADYQTLFAAREGAVAAPTAGLHFTPALVDALEARGVRRVAVTLHVGAGTFLPVTAEDPREHRMHAEWGEISAAGAAAINAARDAGGRIVAVGSTALRLLESAAGKDGRVRPFAGSTDIFILPGYRFRVADLMLTNFHLPRSTLFMLVCAFAGTQRMKRAYAHAIQSGYRFFSYGDACLLHRAAA
jgi:S-adenosylmethionine:tRNA ribosyltransferase-isomerase